MIRRRLLGLALLLLGSVSAPAADSPRERISFDNDWRFTRNDPADVHDVLAYKKVEPDLLAATQEWEDAAPDRQQLPTAPANNPGKDITYVQPDFDDSGWRQLNLPHDWAIEGPFKQEYSGDTGKLAYWGIGWYRKKFDLPKSDEGGRVHLQIDGAMSYSMVWINGHFVGGWPYGYTSYQVDLTPYLNFDGANVVAVRLDNPNKSSRWYPGGGIYRHVWLEKTSPVHVAYNGTYVTTPDVSAREATVDLKVRVENHAAASADLVMTTAIYELAPDDTRSGTPVAKANPVPLTVPNGTRELAEARVTVPKPKLWDIASPNRYVAVTTLTQNGNVVDEYETPFGIRTIKFDPTTGFQLNGRHVEINGTCNHGDFGALGTALNDRALQRQLEILKEMGCNALRTTHNPPAPELLTFADKMGFLVMDEAFDCWVSGKNGSDYHLLFPNWHHKDLRAMIRRDRNHPSVILWSTGNEIAEQDGGADGRKTSQDLTDAAHNEDPTRPVTAACSYPDAGTNGFQKTLDVFGYNYKFGLYEKVHQANPAEPIFGSETASTLSSRGDYFFPPEDDKTNFQVSSYDLTAPGWASPPDPELKAEARLPFVAGQFLWTGFDYLGEPTPYNNDATNLLNFTDPAQKAKMAEQMKALGKLQVPSRSSYFGAVDLAGFKKDLFYFMQAAWLPDHPMAHILPHWNWPERVGLITPVYVYTSGDEAELFLNGKSLGRRKKDGAFRLEWNEVTYVPGELKAVAYKHGHPWAVDLVKTTGPATALTLTPDRATINADGRDLSFITVAVTDNAGLTVPRSMNPITFSISGPGEIVATDNGDATSLVPFQSTQRQAFNGLALVIVRSHVGQPGNIIVKATSDGLTPAEVTLQAK